MNSNLERINLPSISVFKRYLDFKGWNKVGKSKNYTEYMLEDNVELLLPNEISISNYNNDLVNVLNILSQLYEEKVEDLITKIQTIRADIIRSKVPDQIVTSDTINLETAGEFINSLRKLMISSASAEVNKGEDYFRSPKEALDYAKTCRFGHTFKGSFGFVIESPFIIDENEENQISIIPTVDKIEVPFERSVVSRISRGFRTLENAADEDSIEPLLEGSKNGFNSNMLNELMGLFNASLMNAVTFDFIWSEKIPQHEDLKIQGAYFNYTKYELVETAYKILKQKSDESFEEVVGFVTQLKSDIDRNYGNIFHDNREIVIEFKNRGKPSRNVRVKLSEEKYLLAIQAHEEGRLISLYGRLGKIGKYWYLSDPKNFKIL